MLVELRIRDLAIVEDLRLSFGRGLNVVTGETGAGKSILVRALTLLCGARCGADVVRAGAQQASIEALFELERPETLATFGLDPDSELAMRRVISDSGRSRIHANGSPLSATQAAKLARHLLSVYGQHDQTLLLDVQSHLLLLDHFAGTEGLRGDMAAVHAHLTEARRNLAEAIERRRERAGRQEFLETALEELRRLSPQPGEMDKLRRERERLRNAHRILETGEEAEAALYSSDDAVVAVLARVERRLQELEDLESGFADAARLLAEARSQIEEAALQVRKCTSSLASDPSMLESTETRLASLRSLARKHGVGEDELHELAATFERELEQLAAVDDDERRLKDEAEAIEREALDLARRLSEARRAAAHRLEAALVPELEALGMPGARISVQVDTPEPVRVTDLRATGADRVEILLAANPGEPFRPLSRIASGGELSRVLLAVKALTAAHGEAPTLIFDEVDAGIGGSVADAVARRLKKLARHHQILCISHLPQIAARADHHYAVEKVRSGARTVSRTRELAGEERIDELRRMLGGELAPREATRYAKELLRVGAAPDPTP